MIASCGIDPPVDRTLGVAVLDWSAQTADREGLSAEVSRCAERLDAVTRRGQGGRLVDGSRIKFSGDLRRSCGIDDAAGCWWLDLDLIVLAQSTSMRDSALCHELAHRARYVWKYNPDYAHADTAWWDAIR